MTTSNIDGTTTGPISKAKAMSDLADEIGKILGYEVWEGLETGKSSITFSQAGLTAICARAALRALRVQAGHCNPDGSMT